MIQKYGPPILPNGPEYGKALAEYRLRHPDWQDEAGNHSFAYSLFRCWAAGRYGFPSPEEVTLKGAVPVAVAGRVAVGDGNH